jgi:hypothetical protein
MSLPCRGLNATVNVTFDLENAPYLVMTAWTLGTKELVCNNHAIIVLNDSSVFQKKYRRKDSVNVNVLQQIDNSTTTKSKVRLWVFFFLKPCQNETT